MHGVVAQLVEHLHGIQLVEHLHGMQGVVGSSPISSTRFQYGGCSSVG